MNKKKYLLLIIIILSIITSIFYNINNHKKIRINTDFILDLKLEKVQIIKVLPGKDLDNNYICVGRLTDSIEAEDVYIISEETKKIINRWNEDIKNIKMSLPIYREIETKKDIIEIKKMDKKCNFFELNYIDNLTIEVVELKEIREQDFLDNIGEMEIYYNFLKKYKIIIFS